MMKPTENLMHDHQVIEMMLGIMKIIAEKINKHHEPDLEEIEFIIDFLRVFADKYHHGKEEIIYFPELIEAGMSNVNSPVAVMLFEHEVGRGYIKDMASSVEGIKSGDRSAIDKLGESLLNYVDLLENHIQKENNMLFPLGNKILPVAKQEVLYKHFKVMEENVINHDLRKHYDELLHHLEKKYLV